MHRLSLPRVPSRHLGRQPKVLHHHHISTSTLPRVAQPSLWKSLIPKPLRSDPRAPGPSRKFANLRSWARNPVTPVFCLALLIGSQAIQLLTLKNEMRMYSRKAEAKIALLREVIERVHRGEDVDVEKVLGTGDPRQEEEWWDVIKELESEEEFWKKTERQSERTRLMKQGRRAKVEAMDRARQAQEGKDIAVGEGAAHAQEMQTNGDATISPTRPKPVFF